MSATNGTIQFPAEFLGELRARTPLAPLIGRTVKLTRAGKNLKGLCPFHAEKSPSLTVYPDHFKCFGCGKRGDVIDFVRETQHVDFQTAVKQLAADAGMPLPGQVNGAHRPVNGKASARKPAQDRKPAQEDDWQPMVPPPADAPEPTADELRCDMLHTYPDANNRPLLYVRRFEARGDKRKMFLPLTYGTLNGKTGWHGKAPDAPRPLYNLPRLIADPEASVIIAEGEKSADAAQRLFPLCVCVTWHGGAQTDHLADWSPLEGRNSEIIIWPDADGPGHEVAARIAARLPKARILQVKDLSEGFDAADLSPDHPDPEAWLEARLPPEPEPTKPQSQIGRLRIYSDDDLLTLPPRDYLVKGWLCPGEISLLVGAKNARKTFLALHVGRAVAQGRSVFGRRVKQAPVLYVVCEGEAGIAKRVQALAQRYGRTDNFHVIAQPLDLLRSTATEGDLSDLIEAAQVYKVGLIVVDTVSRVMNGGEENGPADMGALLGNLNVLRHATGAHVQGIHHGTQEDGTKSRGHSSLPNGADAIAQVAWGGDISGMGTVTLGFARDDETGSIGAFRTEKVELGVDADGDPISTLLIEETEADEPASVAPKKGLNEEAISLHRHMVDLMDRYGKPAQPLPGMDPIPTIDRKFFHQCLIERGWLLTDKLTTTTGTFSEKLTGKLTGDGGEEKVPDREWIRLNKRLTSLQIKGMAYFNRRYVWLGKP